MSTRVAGVRFGEVSCLCRASPALFSVPAPDVQGRLAAMARPVIVEQSRAIPVGVQQAFDGTLPAPLTDLFNRRYAVLPPIREVRDQEGTWGRIGQTRLVVTTDGGTMREQLVDVDAPHSFAYRLSNITGPMQPLVDSIEGRWEFTQAGTGTLVVWRWTLHPKGVGAPFMPLIGWMWRSYARQALEQLSDLLLLGGSH
jgi:hypothetical protein